MFNNFFKTTMRNLWTNKAHSFLNIFGLAVGITAAGLIFLWIEDEYGYDQQNSKRNYLYGIQENQAYNGKIYTYSATPGLLAPAMKSEIPGIANTARTSWNQSLLFGFGDKTIFEKGLYADSSIFSMLSIFFIEGKPTRVFDELHSIVISKKMAKKFFGNERPIVGKTIKVDNRENYVVSGVFKDIALNSTIRFEWASPFKIFFDRNNWLNNWGANGIKTYVELLPKTAPAAVNKTLLGYIQKRAKDAVARPFLYPMTDWRLRNQFIDGKQSGGRIQFVSMFSIIAWIILLIACINFMNLATARSEKRAREVGVRKVLGAEKKYLVFQFIGEAMLLSVISVIFSILFILLMLPSFNQLVEKQLHLGLADPKHLVFLIFVAVSCGLVAGSYPAIYLSSFKPVTVLKGLRWKGGSAASIRKGLVIFQFTISIILIVSTIIIYQQMEHVKSRDLGYNKDNLISMDVRGNMGDHFSSIKQDLLRTGKVENAAISSLDILNMGNNTDDYTWEGKDPNKKILITNDLVSPEYLTTTGTKLKTGRDFQNQADSTKVIINETLADLMGKGDPVGRLIHQDTSKYEVIGVVKNIVYGDMYGGSDPLIFFCYPKYSSNLYIRMKPGEDREKALAQIEMVMKSNNPGYPFDYQFVDQQFNEIFKTEMLIGRLSRVFASLAIIISCLGLFGLTAYTAERRTKEIGIRKVLGASVSGITALLSRDFLQLVLVSGIIAFPLSWWFMHGWLQNYAYRIDISGWVFILAALLAVLIALVTISFQSVRAALANPVKSLRNE